MPRKPTPPATARGRAIVQHLAKKGLSTTQAARIAGVDHGLLFDVIHRNPPKRMTDEVIVKLVTRLGLPLKLVSPRLASLPALRRM